MPHPWRDALLAAHLGMSAAGFAGTAVNSSGPPYNLYDVSGERNEAALAAAATALASDVDACQEALAVAEEFLEVENEALEGSWWR